ncbi:hypothetical protein QE152_g29438 [Popillia japonica]|uniref:Uncharacterized protein n=1 Tax=Popillia japonica TaxID=7064 RepID=A0AAW1JI03_POPJA
MNRPARMSETSITPVMRLPAEIGVDKAEPQKRITPVMRLPAEIGVDKAEPQKRRFWIEHASGMANNRGGRGLVFNVTRRTRKWGKQSISLCEEKEGVRSCRYKSKIRFSIWRESDKLSCLG